MQTVRMTNTVGVFKITKAGVFCVCVTYCFDGSVLSSLAAQQGKQRCQTKVNIRLVDLK